MTPTEFDSYLAQKEREKGLLEGELRAIWKQESGGSVDTGLKGPWLPRWKSQAVGPLQVVPAIHPSFPVNGSLAQQADYASDYYASRGKTPEERAAGYYGRGKPLPGHPTTDQYVQQVSARLQSQPQPVQPPKESPMQYQTEDPEELARRTREAYNPSYTPRVQYEDPYAGLDLRPREVSALEKWLTNPLTQGGIAMLAANSSDPLANIGYGLQVAGAAYGQRNNSENELLELQMRRADVRRKARRETVLENRDIDLMNRDVNKQERLNRLADSYEGSDPNTAELIRAGVTSGLGVPTSFAPQLYKNDKGEYVEVVFDNKGNRKERPVPAGSVPFNAYMKTPEMQGQGAYATASGSGAGKADAERDASQNKAASDADEITPIIASIRGLVPKSTGSGAGALVDKGLGFLGYATPGAQSVAELQILGNQLIRRVPRFEGPQSDRDVELYKQAAGDVANPNLPIEVRMAAVDKIDELNQRVRGRGRAASPYAPSVPRTDTPMGSATGGQRMPGVKYWDPATRSFK